MDFRQLQYIMAVAEHQNITRAAAALYISQPSLSHFIARTEDELGVKLFDRSTSPLKLTYAGEQYLKNAQEILRVKDRMMSEFRDISGNMKGRLHVGVPHERAAYMLPLILPQFKRRYPGIDVDVDVTHTHRLLDYLSRGRVDFAILPCFPDSGFETMEVYRERLVLAAPPRLIDERHRVDGVSMTVDPCTLGDLPFILSKKGHGLFRRVGEFLAEYSLSPQTVFESTSNITSLRLAAAGLGVAIVPEMTTRLAQCPAAPEIYRIGVPSLEWSIALHYRKDAYVGDVERAFFEAARNAFEEG